MSFLEKAVDDLAARVRTDASGAKSLAHVCAVVPTAQSGRRLRFALAERLGALVPPCVKTPLALLLDADDRALAGRTDEIAAFAEAIGQEPGRDRMATLEEARRLADVRAVLLPKALSFADVAKAVAEDLPDEAERWRSLAETEKRFLAALERRGKRDRIAAAREAAALPLSARPGFEEVEETVRLDELSAESLSAGERPLLRQVVPCATPADEAERVADVFAEVKPDEAWPALCVADPALFPEVVSAFKARGMSVHNPALTPLASSSLGRLVRQLVELRRTQSYAVFSAFVRSGDARRWIRDELGVTDEEMTHAVEDLDNRQAEFLPEKVDDIAPKTKGRIRAVFELVQAQLRKRSLRSLLGSVFRSRTLDEAEPGDREFAAAAEAVSDLLTECGDDCDLLALRLDEATYSLEPDAGDDIVTDGWLELPFLDADEVVIAGFQEGRVPESVVGHPYLPDSLRRRLGLADNAAKERRDRAILAIAIGDRRPDAVRFTFHSADAKGDVTKPSRLLFETDDDADLVRRVKALYGGRAGTPDGPVADLPKAWKLRLPVPPPFRALERISPTRLDAYLRCPFTFYLNDKSVLGDKRLDDCAEELQGWEYGNLAHEALEAFGRSELKDSAEADDIAAFLEERVDAQLAERFGTSVPAIVWMQGESVKSRLRHFAAVQAAHRAAGWRIVDVERKLELSYSFPRPDGSTGTTRFHGKCDRIDRNETTGKWRVIDYKTWDKADADRAQSFRRRKDGSLEWGSLQLAIYCAMLDADGRGEFAEATRDMTEACYCILGKTADDVRFGEPFDGGLLPEAEKAIRELLPRIERGIFWPPSKSGEWRFNFKDWLSPSPEETVDEDWIADQVSRAR